MISNGAINLVRPAFERFQEDHLAKVFESVITSFVKNISIISYASVRTPSQPIACVFALAQIVVLTSEHFIGFVSSNGL
jgi:hypothetical protein